jgi:hypothetical protein
MQEKKITRRVHSAGPQTDEERQRLRQARENAMKEFAPRNPTRLQPAAGGIGAQIRLAREAQGLNWYSLAEKAGVPSADIVRDVEYGREASLPNIEAIVSALGLKLELVELTG